MNSPLLPVPFLPGLLLLLATALPAAAQLPVLRPPAAQVGTAYTYQITSSAQAPAIYTATNLPPGLNLNRTSGAISGVPTTIGVFTGDLTVVDALNLESAATLVITVNAGAGTPVITSAATGSGTVGQAFSYTLTASNTPTSFNVGPLPAGLSANLQTGAISGTPTLPGTYAVAVSANSAAGTGNSSTLTLTIAAAASAPMISSAAAVSGTPGTPFTYAIVASNTPTSYGATGLPLGLTLDATTGIISGTPQVSGLYQPVLTARNASGQGPAFSLALSLGNLPGITSASTATGTVGTAFSYTLTASNSPVSYNVGPLPAGLRADTTTGAVSGTPTTAGVTTVTISANNASGTGAAITLTLTVNAAPPAPPPSGGGGGGGGSPLPANVTPPVIVAQPAARSLEAGNPLTVSVSATGASLNFQWFKDSILIRGAQSATYTVAAAGPQDAGAYTVYVSNGGGALTSSPAVITITPARVPVISSQPAPITLAPGGSGQLAVVAEGSSPLSYQWSRGGIPLTGATNSALPLANATAETAGSYTVAVSNRAGTVTSVPAAVTVTSPGFAGAYFGTFDSGSGTFALFVRGDRSGALIGLTGAGLRPVVSTDLRVDAEGRFTGSFSDVAATPVRRESVTGSISPTGSLTGQIGSSGARLAASAPVLSGSLSALAGFYRAGETGTASRQLAVVAASGAAYLLTLAEGTAEGVTGTVGADGQLVAGSGANASTGIISPTRFNTRRGTASYAGGPDDGTSAREKLLNLSTRSLAGSGNESLIAGFVVTGNSRKSMLIRAVGPTLAREFGVSSAVAGVRLEVTRDGRSIGTSGAWATRPDASAIASAASRVGAFPLAPGSEDAALLLDLEPGAYTAVVSSSTNSSGVALIEVYDASGESAPRGDRTVNLSTRAGVGTGERVLIAGFFVGGDLPKRMLVRGIGPSLRAFGLPDALARPTLTLFRGGNSLARNSGWAGAADVAAAGLQAGAFPLAVDAQDAALLLHLAPGAYTAQITGEGTATGVALVEVYELD
jgi:hypothetical protein